MKLTINDICNFPELNKLVLIAGAGGLNNEVEHCGILDYEFDKDVMNKYSDYNYAVDGGFLTLTSFLYAKQNPNLIFDAVKKLIFKNGSGLIIKNIFRLPISDTVIRYANNMNFPIFLLNDSYPFFEDIIILINKAMERKSNIYYHEHQIDLLMHQSGLSSEKQYQTLFEIFPFLQNDLMSIYLKPAYGTALDFNAEVFTSIEDSIRKSGTLHSGDSVFYYHDGILIIHSKNHIKETNPSIAAQPFIDSIMEAPGPSITYRVGISDIHHFKEEVGLSIRESLYSVLHSVPYADLGIYQAILPFCHEQDMLKYSKKLLYPINEYDNEHNGEILKTLRQFILSRGNIADTADAMAQHQNTIRYRLKKAWEITGINPLSLDGYEQMALAIQIRESENDLETLPFLLEKQRF